MALPTTQSLRKRYTSSQLWIIVGSSLGGFVILLGILWVLILWRYRWFSTGLGYDRTMWRERVLLWMGVPEPSMDTGYTSQNNVQAVEGGLEID